MYNLEETMKSDRGDVENGRIDFLSLLSFAHTRNLKLIISGLIGLWMAYVLQLCLLTSFGSFIPKQIQRDNTSVFCDEKIVFRNMIDHGCGGM